VRGAWEAHAEKESGEKGESVEWKSPAGSRLCESDLWKGRKGEAPGEEGDLYVVAWSFNGFFKASSLS